MDDLLDKLVGRWKLQGKMGDSALYQSVTANWVLRGSYLEVLFKPVRVGENGNPDYEAMYLIGHDKKTNEYILHLFDTYPVSSKPVPGIGVRQDNSIHFKFNYNVGPWLNVFTWMPESGSWKNTITYEKDGKKAMFAEKELIPFMP